MSGQNCACPSGVTRSECIDVRYGECAIGETCECLCHDADDDENEEFYASQQSDFTEEDVVT